MTKPNTTKETICHHCGKRIEWQVTWPDKKNSHWAHLITFDGKRTYTPGNELREQRCASHPRQNGYNKWATPKRNRVKLKS